MMILGLDPSLSCTGWGVIRAEGSRVSHVANGQVPTDAKAPITERLAALQAALAECHAVAPSTAATDWHRIVMLYDALLGLTTSPVVALNRAVAVAMADPDNGPRTALDIVDHLDGLDGSLQDLPETDDLSIQIRNLDAHRIFTGNSIDPDGFSP